MFNCKKCGETSLPGEKLRTIVTATRDKHYPARYMDKRTRKLIDNPVDMKNILTLDKGGTGTEIVSEAALCLKCSFSS